MLCGSALQYYFDVLKEKDMDLNGLTDSIKNRFQTSERSRALLGEWEGTSFESFMAKNDGKNYTECLEILIGRLSDIKISLPSAYRGEEILKDKSLNSVREIDACRLAYHKPAETLEGIISDLHASMATSSVKKKSGTAAHLVDRRL